MNNRIELHGKSSKIILDADLGAIWISSKDESGQYSVRLSCYVEQVKKRPVVALYDENKSNPVATFSVNGHGRAVVQTKNNNGDPSILVIADILEALK